MPTETGIYIGMSEEQKRIHRLRRSGMGKNVTWADYIDKLAELADRLVLKESGEP